MKIISKSSVLTRNIRPTVASRISERYSPTWSVNLPDVEISTVKIVSTSSATFTKSDSGFTTSRPLSKLNSSWRVKAKIAADAQPRIEMSAPTWKRAGRSEEHTSELQSLR